MNRLRTWLVLIVMLLAMAFPAHAADGDGVRSRLAKPAVLRSCRASATR